MSCNVFLDIGWYQDDVELDVQKDEIVSLAALFLGEGEPKQYFTYVKPIKHEFDGALLYSIKANVEDLASAPNIKSVMQELVQRAQNIDLFVVWSKPVYDLLEYSLIEAGLTLTAERIVILQDVLQFADIIVTHTKDMSFFLDRYKINYNKKFLYDTKHSVLYLHELYKHTRNYYKHYLRDWNLNTICNAENSWIAHHPQCCYARHISADHVLPVAPTDFFDGLRPCRLCMKRDGWRKNLFSNLPIFEKELRAKRNFANKQETYKEDMFSDENIARLCKEHGLSFGIRAGVIYVETSRASWLLYHDDKEVQKIYHENHKRTGNPVKVRKHNLENDINRGYHDQNVPACSLREALDYIVKHDSRKHNYQPKQSRLDKIFASVKENRRQNKVQLGIHKNNTDNKK